MSFGRRAAMVVAGMGLALAPMALQAPPAQAAQTQANKTASLTFVGSAGAVTCTISNSTTHNTDDPNQPSVTVGSGESGSSNDCFDFVLVTIEISYKDKSGVMRTAKSSAFATSSMSVQGAYAPITTKVTADYFNCDSNQSATCTVATVAQPK